jgi:aspartate aminotransferase
MLELADRTRTISASMTLAISGRARAMREEGIDVCNFGVGEPDFITPEPMRQAAKDALDAGQTKYAPEGGVPRLRQLIARKLAAENGLQYRPEQVMVSTGGKQALFNALVTLLGPGDECLIPAPYWVSYPEIVKLARAVPVYLPTTVETGFKITAEQLDRAINSRTRALILNSPSNPTGMIYTRDELEALAEVIVRHEIAVIADEIYEKLIYDDAEHISIGSLNARMLDLTITCNGFSKAYAATGWRLGYAAGPAHVIKAAIDIQSHSTSGANTFAQYGAIAALEGPQDAVEAMRQEFALRRDLMHRAVISIPGLACVKPAGAFYLFIDIRQTGLDSTAFCRQLLEEGQVAAVPGIAFGMDDYIRLSYATDRETIQKGVERLERFVRSLS